MRFLRMSAILALALGSGGALGSHAAWADSAVQVPLGARAMAMGGAFTSIADDATAPFWNPAGLPWIGHQEIGGHHANLFGSDIQDNYAAFVLPLTPRHAAAMDFYHSGFDDTELDFGESRIDLAYGLKIGPFLSAGVTAKYLARSTSLDGATVRRGQGVGADAGVLFIPRDRLRLALVLQDAFDTRLTYSTGSGNTLAYPRTLRFGASYRLPGNATVALDLDERYHVGAEYQVIPQFALRAGLQEDPAFGDGITTSFGAGIAYGVLRFDYARVDHPTLGATNHFGVSLGFNFNPSRIRIEKVEPRSVFSSLYKTYVNEPFGTVQVRNLADEGITANVQTFVPGMMTSPSRQTVILRPKAVQEIPLTAVFDERAMDRHGDRPVQVEISATDLSGRLPRTEKTTARMLAYGAGAIDWSAGVSQAAAFITVGDPVVDAVARDAVRVAADRAVDPGLRNVTQAAGIFDALGALGITYVQDRTNPYSEISETPRAVDTISYPRETLVRRTGDCDDTSVLYAALLGNVGIATQLVDVPGHLFVLVDTGVHERNRLSLALGDGRTVVADERVWIPVETTALQDGFARAWTAGAETYASWTARGKLSLVDVTDSQSRYAPAELRDDSKPAPELNGQAMLARLDQDLKTIRGWRSEYLAERYGETQRQLVASAEALNEIAHVYYGAGQLEEARIKLEQALRSESRAARTRNNLANVLVAQGDVDAALPHYEAAIAAEDGDGGVWLNLGMVRHASGDTLEGERDIAGGISRAGGYEQACHVLGLEPDSGVQREGTRKLSPEAARQLLKAALRRVPAAASSDSTRQTPGTAPRGPRKPPIRVIGGRGGEAELRDLLYWKP